MSYVKKYDAGKINLDLPKISANLEDSVIVRYKHVLPLFSFGDIQHDIGLSLVFDHERYVIETESNTNPFFIAPGFKLNLQKKLIFGSEATPRELMKENGDIVALNNHNGVFTINDQSQGIVRVTAHTPRPPLLPGPTLDPGATTYYTYTIEYPDFSKEKYNDFGLISAVYDKYSDTPIISYTYGTNRNLMSISFKGSVAVTFDYDNDNRLSAITCNERRIRFSYDENEPFSIVHYIVQMLDGEEDGEDPIGLIHQYTISNTGLTVDAISNDSSVERTCTTKLELIKETETNVHGDDIIKTIKITDSIDNYIVNKTTCVFPENLTYYVYDLAYVDITDNNNVTTRLQFWDDKIMCSYEVDENGPRFEDTDDDTKTFLGNVTLYDISENTNNKFIGIRKINDGMSPIMDSDGNLCMGHIPSLDNDTIYYNISGWIKSDTASTPTIYMETASGKNESFDIYNYSLGQWIYFSTTLENDYPIKISLGDNVEDIYLCDVRLICQNPSTTVEEDEKVNAPYMNTSKSVLFYGEEIICLNDAEFNYDINEIDHTTYSPESTGNFVTISDILRYKLTKRRNGVCNEIFHNNGKKITTAAADLKVLHNGSYINISEFDIGTETYSKDHKSTTRICINEDDPNADIIKIHSVDGTVISEETLDDNLDVTRSESSGVITEYERDSYGLITSENVYTEDENNEKIYAKQMSYSYGTGSSGIHTMTVTDEFGNDTVYTYDKFFGEVSKIKLPNGKYIYNDYDAYCGELSAKHFNSRSGRSNYTEYSNGIPALVSSEFLNYKFEYDTNNHTLAGIKKNDVNIEHHTNQKLSMGTSIRSYYPSETNPIHSERVYTDQYGRLESIDGVLENSYDNRPRWYYYTDEAYNISEDMNDYNRGVHGDLIRGDKKGDGKDAMLAQSEDILTGEITKYGYNSGKLNAAVTENSNESIIRQETFGYDKKNRLTKNHFEYDITAGESVTSDIEYEMPEDSPLNDNKISSYSYKVNGEEKAKTFNHYSQFERIYLKTHCIGNTDFYKMITYDHTRISDEDYNGTHQTHYDYDNMGRIASIDNGSPITYTYDDYGQLIREDNLLLDKTFVYEYNDIGNIVKVKEYDYTTDALGESCSEKTYTYSSSQPDKLTSFDGHSITYNAMGCPTSFNGFNATWTRGKLSGLSRSGSQIGYGYNALGQRIRKTTSYTMAGVTGYRYDFYYDESGRLICEKKYSDSGSMIDKLVYLYDESSIIGVDYTINGATNTYFFERNLLGDVIGIYDTNGVQVGKYKYDAWGNCTTTLDTTGIAYRNPIRYRGYYYDTESGLYYLNARYYNPEWRRFISSDSTEYLDPESVNGLNLYCYCNNDPVNYADPSGHFPILLAFIIGGALIGATLGGITAYSNGQDILTGALTGALLGAAVGGIIGVGGVALSGAVSSVLGKTATDLISVAFYGGEFGSWEDYAVAFTFGGLTGSLGSVTGKFAGLAKAGKFAADVAIRPAANQVVKMGTRGNTFNADKYLYDVITRTVTYGDSNNIIKSNMFGLNLKVDLGKCFYRSTFRSLYSYI